jgi:hypothetical protein
LGVVAAADAEVVAAEEEAEAAADWPFAAAEEEAEAVAASMPAGFSPPA